MEALFRIQELDTKIFELRERLENHPLREELAALQEEAENGRSELEAVIASLEEHGRRQASLEREVQTCEEKLGREESKLYSGEVSNPKELRGLQAEVRSLKSKKDGLETQVLEEMEQVEELEARLEDARSKAGGLQAAVDEKKAILEGETSRIKEELAGLEAEKAAIRSQVDEELLELYDSLLESRHNLAVAKVIEGVCQGCRVELPGMDYDRFLKTDGIFRCTNCGRILVK
jgi:predicted  nucleic acid-binding Zn-ribbon protein